MFIKTWKVNLILSMKNSEMKIKGIKHNKYKDTIQRTHEMWNKGSYKPFADFKCPFPRRFFVMIITLLLEPMLWTNHTIMYICTYKILFWEEDGDCFPSDFLDFFHNHCYVILIVSESRGPCWGNLKAPDMFNYSTETCEKQSWVSLGRLQCIEIKM